MKTLFSKLLKDARFFSPRLEVELLVGKDQEFPQERDYAYCALNNDGSIEVVVAPDFEDLSEDNQEALLRHELAHALEFELGEKRIHYLFGPILSRSVERRADEVAELIWGDPILYGSDDIQTLEEGEYPRPARLGL